MLLAAGARLGPYEILGPLGSGGMGDVYMARDTRLERTVAVKVSKEAFGERFRNEALAVAALNHPHIATLFDVGPDYLVMEYVDGKPLRGPLPAAEALPLALQIADALEHAHRHGVVHRDLKPSNILVTKAGVKVLDFGLAQRRSRPPAAGDSQPTLTEEGTLLGTPGYMTPEQIDGKKADERTDVFAFGLVLYELLTGQRAFDANSAAGVMAAILEKDPTPISALKPSTPAALEQVIDTCLAKDPADRWQSVRELKHVLAWASRPPPPSVGRNRGWIAAAAVAAALLVIGSGAALLGRRPKLPRAVPIRFQLALPPKTQMGILTKAVVSPDGQRLAFTLKFNGAADRLLVRPLDALTATEIPGSERGYGPFWSPDSRQVAFWGTTGLSTADSAGGAARVVCATCRGSGGGGIDFGASWGPTDLIVYSDVGALFIVAAQGGEPRPLGGLAPGETGRFWLQFLPDGRHYLYLSLASRMEDQGIYVGELGSDLRKRLVAAEYGAAYSPPGYLVYIKDEALVAQPFDAERLTLSGDPVPILDEPVERFRGALLAGRALFSVSSNGVLAWRPHSREIRQLTWFDRSGRKTGTVGEPGEYVHPALSRDEKSVAVCEVDSGNRDVRILDVPSGASRRLTFDPGDDCGATWSPDGRWIAFFSDRRGVRELYRKRADGSGDDELLLASEGFGLNVEDWSGDGRFLSYNSARPGQSHDIFVLPFSPEGKASPVAFLATPAMETASAFAPNGRYLAYMSNESGEREVYVREVTPQGKPGPGKWQISYDRGHWPQWRPDGRELFFFGGSGMMAVDVRTDGPRFVAGAPRRLAVEVEGWEGGRYGVSRDGQRFLFDVPTAQSEAIRVLVNWLPRGGLP